MAEEIHFGRYILHEQLGKGGFGSVYRATDSLLGRAVALKILHPQLMVDPDFVTRFLSEAKVMASFEHPNISSVYDAGEVDGRVFIAMRYYAGGSLRGRLDKEGRIAFPEALAIIRQVCAGLQSAHKRGIVHRDIKPENILFTEDGQAVISDFGLAKAVQSSSSSSSSAVGTPFYRPPELWNGKPPASPATDEYSLACVLVEMLSGVKPFGGDTTEQVVTRHLVTGPELPEQWPQGVPAGTEAVLRKAMAKKLEERYAGVEEFAEALEQVAISGKEEGRNGKVEEWTTEPEQSVERPAPASQAASIPHEPVRPVRPVEPVGLVGPARPVRQSNRWLPWAGVALVMVVAWIYIIHTYAPAATPVVWRVVQGTPTPATVAPATQAPATAAPATAAPATPAPTISPTANEVSESWFFTYNSTCNNGKFDIYLLKTGESDVLRLTNNSYDDGDSVVSPDGKKVAFFSERDGDREVYTMNIDGSNVNRLTFSPGWDSLPAWSPDGKQLAFTSWRDGYASIYLMNEDGTNVRKLTSNPSGDWMPYWSPDGKHIAFASWNTSNISEIYIMNIDGSSRKQITNLHARSFHPIWSPDGNLILFYSDAGGIDQNYLMNNDGSELRKLIPGNEPLGYPNSSGFPNNAWSPDSQAIIFSRGNGFYLVNTTGSNIRLSQQVQCSIGQ